MFRFLVACCVVLSVAALGAQSKEQSRLETCGVVMEEILGVEDNIPRDLLDKAECVIVIPSMMNVALGVGGNFGRGAMLCRSGKAFDGAWGAPAMYTLDGGSIGFQLGAESTDLVLLVMNPRGVSALLGSKVKLGGKRLGLGRAQGPHPWKRRPTRRCVPRSSATPGRAACSPACRSSGASLRPDNDANREVYGLKHTARRIVTGRP